MKKDILILEDDIIIAESIKLHLDENDFAGSIAVDVQEAVDLLNKKDFSLIISDINLNDRIDGIDFVKKYIKDSIPVIFLTAYSDEETLNRIGHSKAYAFITKPFKKAELIMNVNLAIANFRKNIILPNVEIDTNVNLSKREMEILKLVIKSKTSDEIADLLSISPQTVSTHRKNILRKTNAKSNLELFSLAAKKGWI